MVTAIAPSTYRTLALAGVLGVASLAQAQSGVWTSTVSGDYFSPSNWQGGVVATGAGNTADLGQVDLNGDVSVTIDQNLTIGNLVFGDTNTGTGGVWDTFTSNASVITLDATSPTITVNPLTPATTFDDAFLGNGLAGTNGFTKLGPGILTIGAPSTIAGPINVNAGTLRVGPLGTLAGTAGVVNKTIGNNATIQTTAAGASLVGVRIAANATGTIRMSGSGSNFLNTVQGTGSGTLNIELGVAGATYSLEGDWVTGGGVPVVNFKGLDTNGPSVIRGRINRPAPNNWNPAAFQNSQLNLDNANFLVQTNSFGNNVLIGALSGTSTAVLSGSNNGSGGSAPRYIIGSLNTDSVFAGTVNGAGGSGISPGTGGMSIEKVGTGKLTFSGPFTNSMVGNNTDIGRQGGVIRVSAGTLALAGQATSIPGGFGTLKSTIDIRPGATLDVSGTNSVFTSSPLQQIQGSGTIVGAFNHAAGAELRPGDVSAVDNDTTLTNVPVPTVGTLTFNGNLDFNGGAIAFDLDPTPGPSDLVQVTGVTSIGGGGVVNPNFLGGVAPATGFTYTFLSSAGGFSGSTAGWSVAWPGRGPKPSVFIDGNSLKFTTTPVGGVADILWTGAGGATWDVQTTTSWLNGAAADKFFTGDNVTFNDSSSVRAVTIAGASLTPGSVLVDTTAGYSFSGGSIVANGSLTKRGSGTLTLSAVNTFSSVRLEGGAVDVSATSGTLGTGQITMAGATITNVGNNAALPNSGIALQTGSNNFININGSGGSANRPGLPSLSGNGNLTVTINTNDSWLDLGNTASFKGALTIQPDGVNATTLGTVRAAGAGTTFAGAVVNLNNLTFANQVGGAGSNTYAFGELHANAGVTLNAFIGGSTARPNAIWQIGDLGTNSNFDGVIVDDAATSPVAVSSLAKVGAGVLTMTGVSTYTGPTTVAGGQLSVTNAFFADMSNVLIASSGVLNLNTATTDVVNALYLGGVAQAPGVYGAIGSGAQHETARITGSGTLTVASQGATLLLGDYNQDGSVDSADYTVWRDRVGASSLLPNDGVGGVIGQAQYTQWAANYGAVLPPAVAVPEPVAMASAMALAGGLAAIRRPRVGRWA